MALTGKPLEQVRADVPVDAVTREEVVRINILVPASVRRGWKCLGAATDRTITNMIIEAMREYTGRKP